MIDERLKALLEELVEHAAIGKKLREIPERKIDRAAGCKRIAAGKDLRALTLHVLLIPLRQLGCGTGHYAPLGSPANLSDQRLHHRGQDCGLLLKRAQHFFQLGIGQASRLPLAPNVRS